MVLLTKIKTWSSARSSSRLLPRRLRGIPVLSDVLTSTAQSLNYFRVHALCFTFIPLIAGAIFYASNGQDKIPFLDALFFCYSAMTVTGLNSVLINRCTIWQQVILMLLFIIGSSPVVNIVTLLVRRRFFRRKIAHLVATSANARRRVNAIAKGREYMIDEEDDFVKKDKPSFHAAVLQQTSQESPAAHNGNTGATAATTAYPAGKNFPPRTRTIDFDDRTLNQPSRVSHGTGTDSGVPRSVDLHPLGRRLSRRDAFPPDSAINTGYGGFPNPLSIAATAVVRRLAVNVDRQASSPTAEEPSSTPAPYLSFTPTMGRNSKFKGLTKEQQEELGGVEFRALSLLLKIIISYWLILPLLSIVVLAPWLATSKYYRDIFAAPDTTASPTFFVFFNVYSAFGNCGLSLHDSSLIPFQTSYWMLTVFGFLILAGSTAYPVLLRLVIYTISKVVPKDSQLRQTLQFLLDHPRRCFLYLFPSHQTWYLVFALILLNSIDWVSFLVLDIGNEAIESIPVGTRVFVGLFQAVAVRTCGFAAVNLATVAPGLQVLYVTMFQLAAYPVALSVRVSNVYVEKSMGIFEDEEAEMEVEGKFADSAKAKQARITSSYIGYHARKQLSFDMWWLVAALWLLCIIERAKILDDAVPWVTVFSLLFEVSSAYGCIGLSLGNGITNTSLSGQLRAGSKVLLILVMLRGRHRGLPRAIDRSILLPDDLVDYEDDTSEVLDVARAPNRRASLDLPAREDVETL